MNRSSEISAAAIASLGGCVFERVGGRMFRLRGAAPSWCQSLMGELKDPVDLLSILPFLEGFLPDANEVWLGRSKEALSGTWSQELGKAPVAGESKAKEELVLEARALRLEGGEELLLVQRATNRFQEMQHILQKARDALLGYERLRKEVDRKDLLLHCIVHDLRSPLSGMVGTMSLVQSRKLSADDANELLSLGLEQARYQENMIKSILEAFASEVEQLESFESTRERAPDLRAALETVTKRYASAYRSVDVKLKLQCTSELENPCPVVGREDRLERVLENLLENALRYAPPESTVEVIAEPRGENVAVSIQDQGPGVPEAVQEHMFEKFSQSRRSKGVAGLGLYFCRSTLELWGGTISYVGATGKGACFQLLIPKAR